MLFWVDNNVGCHFVGYQQFYALRFWICSRLCLCAIRCHKCRTWTFFLSSNFQVKREKIASKNCLWKMLLASQEWNGITLLKYVYVSVLKTKGSGRQEKSQTIKTENLCCHNDFAARIVPRFNSRLHWRRFIVKFPLSRCIYSFLFFFFGCCFSSFDADPCTRIFFYYLILLFAFL